MFSEADLNEFEDATRTAIEQSAARVERAEAAGDVEGIIGACKEMIETVAKAVIDALGGTYGSDIEVPKLAKQAMEVLGIHPAGLQERPSLRRISGGLVSVAVGIAELRNTDGTGHGRASPSDLDPSHATLARESATTWCSWTLGAAGRVLREREGLDFAISGIAGGQTFHTGELPKTLDALGLVSLSARDQHKTGVAVARRWNVGGTFLANTDVIEPMASGKLEYPPDFVAGVIEGLLLDQDGYVRSTKRNVDSLVEIANRLPPGSRDGAMSDLADRAEDAGLSLFIEDDALAYAIRRLHAGAREWDNTPAGAAAERLADRLQDLGNRNWDSDFDEGDDYVEDDDD